MKQTRPRADLSIWYVRSHANAQVTVLWPPKAYPPVPSPTPNTGAQTQQQDAALDTFSSETTKLLASLQGPEASEQHTGPDRTANPGSSRGAEGGYPAQGVRLETLKHPLGVVGLQWSPAATPTGM